ncbi:transport-associated protein [Nitrosococcus halophilus Nc 4]|uniref:Transport-associated protein n=1 Tax=Nitrosococcus halophilus (strain Nc4) TaxID=472759 RepID=D5BXL4_NITHN|nr:BON domain-containing protein [Nitrosococcus halophilus]ADE13972.1 transport-associated protein [Nitrosococcus halophilus Nc 4]
MSTQDDTIKQVKAVLEYDERINLHRSPIEVSVRNGTLILEGEVEDLTTKKCALQLLRNRKLADVTELVDRLTVRPTEHRGEGALRDALCQSLLEDLTFHNCTLQGRAQEGGGQGLEKVDFETWQQADREPSGLVQISVEEGVVTLEGHVPSPSHKYLIGAMSWWLRGCRNVENHLEVVPAREETEEELADALRLILEKDRLVEADQIRVDIQDRVITLRGLVATEEEKGMAETNAWCLSGMTDVVNQIQVRTL